MPFALHGLVALHGLATHGSAQAGAGAPAQTASTVSVTSLLFQLVIGLGVVLGVIALVSRLVRGKAGLAMGARRQGTLAVLQRQSLGKGSAVAIVRAAGTYYLLGITQQSVRRIGTLDPAEIELAAGEPGDGPATQILDRGQGSASVFPTTTQRPSSTWTSTIEHLRELTVRRG